MPPESWLHERSDFLDLIRIVASERGLLPTLVEKDYWIMHCLNGLSARNFNYELKGGTSLSKGFGIISRFSEDIDIRIDPACAPFEVFTSPNQTKKSRHIESRKQYALAYKATASLYFGEQISFDTILQKIRMHIEKL